jgi:hypothetical protein
MPFIAVSNYDLGLLFTGDEDSQPCPSKELVIVLCERLQPEAVTDLKNALYGKDTPMDDIALLEREAMARGFATWNVHRRQAA